MPNDYRPPEDLGRLGRCGLYWSGSYSILVPILRFPQGEGSSGPPQGGDGGSQPLGNEGGDDEDDLYN